MPRHGPKPQEQGPFGPDYGLPALRGVFATNVTSYVSDGPVTRQLRALPPAHLTGPRVFGLSVFLPESEKDGDVSASF